LTDKFPSKSTYVAPITVLNADGEPLDDIDKADIKYRITETRAGDDILYETDETDSLVSIDKNNSIVTVRIEASDVTWENTVWEELRVSTDTSAVVMQRRVPFYSVSTEP